METYEVITDVLNDAGVDTVFTLQSDGNMRLLAHLHGERADDFRLIKARHEQAAMAMADGYSRVSDDICVCTIGRGPAVAQTGSALVTARRRGSDFLVVVPESATDSSFDTKGFDQEAYLDTTLDNVISIRSHETVLPGLREGLRRVNTGGGPVAVQVAQNVLDSDFDVATDAEDRDTFELGNAEAFGSHVHPDTEPIEKAVDLYLESDATKAPIILAGRGAIRSDARDAIESLAERMNALLATTLQGRGYFDDHPYSLGFVGHYGGNLANELFMESDYVLAVGCSLNPYTTDSGHLFHDDKKLVHIDADPTAIERYTEVDVGIFGDATTTVEAFESELERHDIDRSGTFWTDRLRDRIASEPPFVDREFPEQPETIDPRDLVIGLDRMVPEDRTVVSDTGHVTRWVLDAIETPTPDDFIWPGEFGSIGLGLPVGIGAALGSDRTCLTVCGDAGFMMSIHEVETAVRYDVPILIVVMNDRALGTEYHSLTQYTDHADVSIIDTPDLGAVARAMGADGAAVRSMSDLEDLEETLSRPPEGPFVVDCKVNREVKHRSK